MAVKFIRVKGRVIPIDEEKYSGLAASKKKRDQKVVATASDTVSKQDAVKALRGTARDAKRAASRSTFAQVHSAVAGAAGTLGAVVSKKRGMKVLFGAVGALGTLNVISDVMQSSRLKKDAKQYRADANRIGKGKLLGKARHSDSARALSSVYAAGTMVPPPPMKK